MMTATPSSVGHAFADEAPAVDVSPDVVAPPGSVVATVAEAVLRPECYPNPLNLDCAAHLPGEWMPVVQGAAAAVAVVGALHKAHKEQVKKEK